jgi:hypothetical protein
MVSHNWYDYEIGLTGSSARFFLRTSNVAGAESIAQSVSPSVWHYVVGTYDGSNMILYVDGSKGTPYPKTGDIQYKAYAYITIGSFDASSEFYKGLIDEVRVYNAAIPTSQIEEQYYAGLNDLLVQGEIAGKEYSDRVVGLEGNTF